MGENSFMPIKSSSRKVMNDFITIISNHKIESILCLIGCVLSCIMFRYGDGISYTAWSLEFWDAFFRGGFSGFHDIVGQNVWNAPHGLLYNQEVTCAVWGIWNLPVLLLQYIFNFERIVSFPILLWSKLFLVICVLASGYTCFKIVNKLSDNVNQACLAAIAVCGSSSLVLISVGYSMQDEILYVLCLLISVYMIICGKKNSALIWSIAAGLLYPLTILFSALIIISSSRKLMDLLWRLITLVAAILLRVVLIPITLDGADQPFWYFDRTTLITGNSKISFLVLVLVLVYLAQFFIHRENDKQNNLFMIYSLSIVGFAICTFSWLHFYRFFILVPFFVINLFSVESKKTMTGGFLAMCIMEYCRVVIACFDRNCLNFGSVSEIVQKIFGTSYQYDISLYEAFEAISERAMALVAVMVGGVAFGCGLWLLFITYPLKKREYKCIIPTKVVSVIWTCCTPLVLGVMCLFLMKYNVVNVNIEADSTLANPITGQNSIEELFRGKSASTMSVTIRPVTWDRTYPENQTLCLDIVDNASNTVVGSASCLANELPNNQPYTFSIDNIAIKSNEWYTLRFYCPDPIDEEENYIYFLRSNSGTADGEHHYALQIAEDNVIQCDYDIISSIITH